jgi:thiamine-phosphate pyrophosphorylase
MMRRQRPCATQWLIVDRGPREDFWQAVRKLPRASGVLVLPHLGQTDRRRLRRWANLKHLTLAYEDEGAAARVHNLNELRRACITGVPMIFLSPMFRTRSHPDWNPLPRMRAATLARIGNRPAIALGGMNERRFRILQGLGFVGWAGVSAWSSRARRALPSVR